MRAHGHAPRWLSRIPAKGYPYQPQASRSFDHGAYLANIGSTQCLLEILTEPHIVGITFPSPSIGQGLALPRPYNMVRKILRSTTGEKHVEECTLESGVKPFMSQTE